MKKVYFFYPKGDKLTGQELASKMILDHLINDYDFQLFHFPAFNRGGALIYRLLYPLKVVVSWVKIFTLLFSGSPKIYVNLGQTHFSLLRDGLPFRILSFFKPSLGMVISLHGHVFTTWEGTERVCKLFLSILKKARLITVLGEAQKEKLILLGIKESSIRIVPNSCELEVFSKDKTPDSINILFLSNLIEEKGYKEYLESLKKLAGLEGLISKVEAVICGTPYEGNINDQSRFIEQTLSDINSSKNVKVNWVKGAYGEEKKKLFHDADIFVFPSKYKVEAQPIVLIEAMASGCAIVTTAVGEIPSTVSPEVAIILKNPQAESIANSLCTLINDPGKLKKMQRMATTRFKECFSMQVYKRNWQQIFDNL